MKPTIVIINSEQFGYNPATYYYCKYLQDKYDIVYICWDYGFEKISMLGVDVKYICRAGGPMRIFRFIKHIFHFTVSRDTIIITRYYKVISSIIRLIRPYNLVLLDIRTGSVHPRKIIRCIDDAVLKLECKLFVHITIISKSLAIRLGLSRKASLLPLGADIISNNNKKDINGFRLLYVGTLHNRNIEKLIEGFAKFYKQASFLGPIKLTIIGAGLHHEVDELKTVAEKHGVTQVVDILGRIPHNQLKTFFDNHNVGVSYVPLTGYYDVQPVTKTFEYLLSGMPVLATNTSENRLVINQENGYLCGDTPTDIFQGLLELHSRYEKYDSLLIQAKSKQHLWSEIVKKFDDSLQQIICKHRVP